MFLSTTSWIDSQSNNFHLTQTQTSNKETLTPGASYNVIYAFTVTATSGTFAIPATPVTYQYESANNATATGESLIESGNDCRRRHKYSGT